MLAEWIKNIVICSILFSVILHVAPDPKMRRYIQIAVGLVMIIVVMNPLIDMMKCDDRIIFNIYEESMGMCIEPGEDAVYERSMEMVVKQFIYDRYGADTDVHVVMGNDMQLQEIDIYVDQENLKKENITYPDKWYTALAPAVAKEYGLDSSRVHLMGE
mgnify:CR=1 FL=1